MNYEHEIQIDKHALDMEWLNQPALFMQYGKHFAQCRLELDQAEEKVKVVRAELDRQIRADPARFKIDKLTETVVTSTILIQDKYQAAVTEQREANYEYEMAKIAVSAFHQRKDALENLVRLHGQNYFAGPKMPRNLDDTWVKETEKKQANARVSFKRKRTQ